MVGRVGIAGDDEVVPLAAGVQAPAQAGVFAALDPQAPRAILVAGMAAALVAVVVGMAVAPVWLRSPTRGPGYSSGVRRVFDRSPKSIGGKRLEGQEKLSGDSP